MSRVYRIIIVLLTAFVAGGAFAGIWRDDFSGNQVAAAWKGDKDNFWLEDGSLLGVSAHPIMTFIKALEVSGSWADYTARCRVNVIMPNLAICSKGALILRHRGDQGIAFALHTPQKTVEVFHLNTREMLLVEPFPLDWDEWHTLRAEDRGENITFYVDDKKIGTVALPFWTGATGVAVEDTMRTLFDDFRAEGPNVPNGGQGTADVRPAGKLTTRWASLKQSR